jgi:hypothetical protein
MSRDIKRARIALDLGNDDDDDDDTDDQGMTDCEKGIDGRGSETNKSLCLSLAGGIS